MIKKNYTSIIMTILLLIDNYAFELHRYKYTQIIDTMSTLTLC